MTVLALTPPWYAWANMAIWIIILWVAVHFIMERLRRETFNYEPAPIMNDGEWACHKALARAASDSYHVFAQVSLYALVRNLEPAGWNRIARKSCDFALVDRQTLETALVIEVDGQQHKTSRRQRRRDAEKDAALASAGIPVLRIPAAKRFDAIHLEAQLKAALKGK